MPQITCAISLPNLQLLQTITKPCTCIRKVITHTMHVSVIPYSLNFSRGKYFAVLPNSAQKINFSWSSFQPCLASVMNMKFRGRKL